MTCKGLKNIPAGPTSGSALAPSTDGPLNKRPQNSGIFSFSPALQITVGSLLIPAKTWACCECAPQQHICDPAVDSWQHWQHPEPPEGGGIASLCVLYGLFLQLGARSWCPLSVSETGAGWSCLKGESHSVGICVWMPLHRSI